MSKLNFKVVLLFMFLTLACLHLSFAAEVNPNTKLSEVRDIYAPGGSKVTFENAHQYVEAPLRASVVYLLQNNIQTSWASANHYDASAAAGYHFLDSRQGYADLGIVWQSLSKENQDIINQLFPIEMTEDPRLNSLYGEFGDNGQLQFISEAITKKVLRSDKHNIRVIIYSLTNRLLQLHIFVPISPEMTVGQVSERYMSLLRLLKPQPKIDYSKSILSDEEIAQILEKALGDRLKKLTSPCGIIF